ncbi:MAG: ABC transporter substrate-binding protein [Spirochaetota bacterium]
MKRVLTFLMMLVIAGALFASGEQEGEAPADPMEVAEDAAMEAPMLTEMVEAGELPPLEDRLPAEPRVVEAVDSIGEYGGTWHRAWRGVNDFHAFGRIIYEPVLRWPRDPADPVQPGLAKDWEWNDDGTELTLYFREGLKWSDGEPFTVDDVIFWWEDIETNENITPAIHTEWTVGGEPMELEKVDDSTITLKFAGPNGLAETVGLAFHGNQWPLGFERFGFFAPRHYLEDFHPDYNEDATYRDFEDAAWEYNTERPSMTAWRITDWEPGADSLVATRNPYYWAVDELGRQLPYIDEVYFYLVDDVAAINTLALQGELDMQHRGIDFSQVSVYMEQADRYDYNVLNWTTAQASFLTFFPNQSYGDEKYRELLQNPKFRQALSLSIDRDLLNEVMFVGQAHPRTITVVEDSALFQPEIENLYAEYDVERANALLDEIGLSMGSDGTRTFPDGSRLELVVETMASSGNTADGIQIVAENWEAVGLETQVDVSTREVYWPRATSNDVMIATWSTDRGLVPMIDPIYQFPFDERSWMAPSWGIWYKTGGEQGREPTDEMKELMDLYDEYATTPDPDAQLEIAKEIVRLSTERLYVISTVGMPPALTIVKDNFHNVQESHTSDWLIMTPGTMDPAHFWIEQ